MRRGGRGRAAAVLLLALLVLPRPAPGEGALGAIEPALLSLSGLPLASVGYESAIPFSQREFTDLISLRAGDLMVPSALREAILTLYRTGRFEQVVARGRRVNAEGRDAVELLFVLSPRKTLGRFSFAGNLNLPDSDLAPRVKLRRGSKVDDSALEDARKRIEEYYATRGFPAASVAVKDRFIGDSPEIDAAFEIREGDRLRLGDVLVAGDPPFGRAAILSLMGSRLGDRFDGEQIDEDVRALTGRLKEMGYFFPKVEATVDRSNPARGAVVLLKIDKGTHTRFEVRGGEAFSRGDLVDRLREAYFAASDPAQAASLGVSRVRETVLASGFPFALLSWEEGDAPDGRLATLTLNEGKKALVGKVTLEGARSLVGDEGDRVLALREGEPFSRVSVDEAVKRLDAHYRGAGFLSQRTTLKPTSFRDEGEHLAADVGVVVEEGVRTLVGELTLTGGDGAASAGSLRADLGLATGDPFVRERLAGGKEAILDRLGRSGYLYAKVTAGEAFADSQRKVLLDVKVEPGPQVHTGPIVVTGTHNLDPRIIRLAADLPRGEVISRERILEAQKRLYRLGVMDSVEVGLADEAVPAEVKGLMVDVRERDRFNVGLRFGYSNEQRLNGEVSFTHRNVGGMARNLALVGRAGSKTKLASATYTIPWFLERPIDFSVSLSDQVDLKESYKRDASKISINFRRELSALTVFNISYVFGGIRLSNVAPGAILSPEDEGKTTVGAVIPEWVYDDRDDKFHPSRGSLVDFRLEVAAREVGSRTQYYRLEGAVHRFYPVGGDVVAGWVARGGLVRSYGESTEVIIDKRFFLGGQNTVRGYALDTLGPRDSEGKPLGGNYLLNLDGELRFPLYKALGGVVFLDSGAVWLGAPPYDDKTLRLSAGTGLRWATPIGPFTLDYARKLNPATSTEDRWSIHFSIGHAF